jgi:hypothetical protein
MGSIDAMEMKNSIDKGYLSMYQGLIWHLRGNHYPPLPISLVQTCIDAINACNEGDYKRQIELPEGFAYKGRDKVYIEGGKVDNKGYPLNASASAIAEWLHLEFYLDEQEW